MIKKFAFILLFGIVFAAQHAQATLINETIGEYNGDLYNSGDPFPLPAVTVGIFSSILTGESITSGMISGTFGNSTVSHTSALELYLGDGSITNDVLVATCIFQANCWTTQTTEAWSHVFTAADILTLSAFSGPLVLSAVQTSEFVIRLGETTLSATATAVPEPGTLALMGLGLVGMILRRKKLLAA